MSTVRLRIFPHTDEDEYRDDAAAPAVSVKLSEFLPVIERAHRERRTWLHDFVDDEVCVSTDLYQVLRAFSSV